MSKPLRICKCGGRMYLIHSGRGNSTRKSTGKIFFCSICRRIEEATKK